jgi:uroporphyrinogen-III synthase
MAFRRCSSRRLADAPRPLPRVLAVGGATAEAARASGAADVVSADGDAAALADLAIRTLDPRGGAVSIWRGRDVAADLAGALTAAGFLVVEHQVYAAEARRRLAPEAAAALAAGEVAAVLAHSARGARAFLAAVEADGLRASLSDVIGVALSPQARASRRLCRRSNRLNRRCLRR